MTSVIVKLRVEETDDVDEAEKLVLEETDQFEIVRVEKESDE